MPKGQKLAAKQAEAAQKELEEKAKKFLNEYQVLVDKHGFQHAAILESNHMALFASLKVVPLPKESPIIKPEGIIKPE